MLAAGKDRPHPLAVLGAPAVRTVTYEDVAAAAQRLRGIAHRTPVHTSATVDERTGSRVFFKCENLQRMGAFKFRGAYNALARLSAEQRARGVLTYSSGNHGQAVALSGRLLGAPVTVGMPADAPAGKIAATRGYSRNGRRAHPHRRPARPEHHHRHAPGA